jgi:hypothetical protein
MNFTRTKGELTLELSDETNEGWLGDYDPKDPNDELLVRFTLLEKKDGAMQQLPDCSYCTGMPSKEMTTEKAGKIADLILATCIDVYEAGGSLKKTCELLSWLGTERNPLK